MKKIKVCHIITKLELGGAQQNTIYTVSHLDRESFLPVLISGPGGILDVETTKLPGVKTYFVPTLIRTLNPFLDLFALLKIFFILLHEKPDIVHTHSSKAGIIGRWAAFFARVPVIIHTFHGYGFNDFQRNYVRRFYIILERITANITNKLITVTNEDIKKGLFNRIGRKNKYIVIRSGIDINSFSGLIVNKEEKKFELGISPDHKLVTTIGPFKEQKNLKDFIKLASIILKSETLCSFLIIGDGALRPELEKQISDLKLQKNVKLAGWRTDINEILAVSDIFVMTSLWEGLPRSILEAMRAGLPVVANSVDGVREIISDSDTGFLIKPLDITQMSERVFQLIRDSSLRKTMGGKARESINFSYHIDYMVKQQDLLYRSLLKF